MQTVDQERIKSLQARMDALGITTFRPIRNENCTLTGPALATALLDSLERVVTAFENGMLKPLTLNDSSQAMTLELVEND